jgi:hypothetical protein
MDNHWRNEPLDTMLGRVLVEQSVSHRDIVDILPGHRDGDDLAAGGIDADIQLPPGSTPGRSVLFDQPPAPAPCNTVA